MRVASLSVAMVNDNALSSLLAHLWGAYAIPVALFVVRHPLYFVCRLCPP